MNGATFLLDARTATAAIDAGRSLGLLDALARPATTDEIAAECGASRHAVAALLEAYRALEVATCDERGRWSATGVADEQLVAPAALEAAVVSGARTVQAHRADSAGAFYPDVVRRLAAWHEPSAARVAELLSRPGLRILDAGAGAAVWSRAFVEREPSTTVTAVDLSTVAAVTRAVVAESSLEGSYVVAERDLLEDELADLGTFDLVLAGNLCHLFDEATVRRLLARLRERLVDGGTLAIVDAVPNCRGDEADLRARLYGVHLLLRTAVGGVWTLADYTRWLEDAGCRNVWSADVSAWSPMSLVAATR